MLLYLVVKLLLIFAQIIDLMQEGLYYNIIALDKCHCVDDQ